MAGAGRSFGLAALLYLVTEELLVEAHDVKETHHAAAMFFVGFLTLIVIDALSQPHARSGLMAGQARTIVPRRRRAGVESFDAMVRSPGVKQRSKAPHAQALRRILLAVDDSAQARDAVTLVISLAKLSAAEVVVVHVRVHTHIHGVRVSMEPSERSRTVLDSALRRLRRAGVRSFSRVASGVVGEEARLIEEVADQVDADLIVVGSRGLSLVRAILEGSVSYDLIHRRRRPVLTVP